MDAPIGLAEFVAQVRRELLAPNVDGADTTPLLSLEQVDLELQVKIDKEGSGRIRVYVIEAGAALKREDVQTVKLTLQPLLSREERVAELRQRSDWRQVVDVALRGTLKDASASQSQRDD